MSRSPTTNRRQPTPDPVYQNILVSKLINRAMYDGKKSTAQKQVYKALELIANQTKDEPLKIFQAALENLKPQMEVRARRVGGAAYQVPTPIRTERKESLAIRWLVEFANKRPNAQFHTFAEKLAAEITDALNNEGLAIKKRNDVHRMAEANKAFAHFRW